MPGSRVPMLSGRPTGLGGVPGPGQQGLFGGCAQRRQGFQLLVELAKGIGPPSRSRSLHEAGPCLEDGPLHLETPAYPVPARLQAGLILRAEALSPLFLLQVADIEHYDPEGGVDPHTGLGDAVRQSPVQAYGAVRIREGAVDYHVDAGVQTVGDGLNCMGVGAHQPAPQVGLVYDGR